MPAEKFSRYEMREELGIGGMATVYRAYDPMFEREVALKILKKELLEDPQVRGRFERETKIIAKLEHPVIVPVYDVGFDNGQLFYVMRYMPGKSLSEHIEGGLTPNEIAHILLRLAAALDYAHGKGVVHRDLKPGNILFDENNNPYISDFGIAKFAQASTRMTQSGIIGTPRYMSPEQARGDEADGRSDLYSMGIILFEMLSGHTPFEATTPLAMAFKHAVEAPPSILKINPNLPEGIDVVIAKALSKQPEDRYNTCAEFTNAFLEVFPEATVLDADIITPLPPRSLKYTVPTELPLAPKPRANSRLWMIAGFIILTLSAFAVWRFSQATTSASTPAPETAAPTSTLSTPTTLPTETITPTETSAPTIPVNPGIGGADKIALTANNDIYLMNIDGTNVRQLTNTDLPKFDLQWLPGGAGLLYVEGKCVYKIDTSTSPATPEETACFTAEKFEGFRVSPDDRYVAISIERRLIVFPFNIELLATLPSAFELQGSSDACLDYTVVAVKSAQWSADGKSLAILYQGAVGDQLRLGDTIRVLEVDTESCQDIDPLITDEFPGRQFIPEDYEDHPVLPAYHWDGAQQFLFNTYKRNLGYGQLYLYDMSTSSARKINPINGICCYRDAVLSPDGTHILLFFQDENRGADSETKMYYIPVDQLDSDITFTPIKLPVRFFPDPRANIEVALRPSLP